MEQSRLKVPKQAAVQSENQLRIGNWHNGIIYSFWKDCALKLWCGYLSHSEKLSGLKKCIVKCSWMHLLPQDGRAEKWFSIHLQVIWVLQVGSHWWFLRQRGLIRVIPKLSSVCVTLAFNRIVCQLKILFSNQPSPVRDSFGWDFAQTVDCLLQMPEICSQTFSGRFPFVPSWVLFPRRTVRKYRFSSSSV